MSRKGEPVVFDADNPEWTREDFARAKPLEAFPELTRAFPKRGRPPLPPGAAKRAVSIRLSPDVLDALRASGPGWQTRVDAILRKALVG